MNKAAVIRAYHERTKHRLNAYARGPEYLDWDDQPDPFRRFEGAPLHELPLLPDPVQIPAKLDKAALSKLLELSMGLSAWKAFGPDRWALRCNPSSGNMHPTESYLVCHGVGDLDDGVYHYRPREHALERRASSVGSPDSPYCVLGFSSIYWREAWKYGERAFRYVQLDVGHALGAVRYAASVLGWRMRPLPFADPEIAELLGLTRDSDFEGAEHEHPDLLVQLLPDSATTAPTLPSTADWRGHANLLGGCPRLDWPVIDEANAACVCERSGFREVRDGATVDSIIPPLTLPRLIRQRRSAQSFIGKQSMLSFEAFRQLLEALVPDEAKLPWDCWSLPARVHPVLFVHRVDGLEPGVYAMPRNIVATNLMREAMSDEFDWQPIAGLGGNTSLYQLSRGDVRKVARALSCHQEIASASSFSLSMLAEYDAALTSDACAYRHLHWEAGLLGQVLYLCAENIGMRGTGIGCFFDDSVHLSLGIEDDRLQSLYHFTVGSPRLDGRIETLPPYDDMRGHHDG